MLQDTFRNIVASNMDYDTVRSAEGGGNPSIRGTFGRMPPRPDRAPPTTVEAPLLIRQDPGSEFSIEFVPVEIVRTPREIEHSALAWVTVEELLDYQLAPSDRVLAETCLAGGAAG